MDHDREQASTPGPSPNGNREWERVSIPSPNNHGHQRHQHQPTSGMSSSPFLSYHDNATMGVTQGPLPDQAPTTHFSQTTWAHSAPPTHIPPARPMANYKTSSMQGAWEYNPATDPRLVGPKSTAHTTTPTATTISQHGGGTVHHHIPQQPHQPMQQQNYQHPGMLHQLTMQQTFQHSPTFVQAGQVAQQPQPNLHPFVQQPSLAQPPAHQHMPADRAMQFARDEQARRQVQQNLFVDQRQSPMQFGGCAQQPAHMTVQQCSVSAGSSHSAVIVQGLVSVLQVASSSSSLLSRT